MFFFITNSYSQVLNLAEDLHQIHSSKQIKKIDVTSNFLNSKLYGTIQKNRAKKQNQTNVVNKNEIGDTTTFFSRNILNQDKWQTVEAQLVFKKNNVHVWLALELVHTDTMYTSFTNFLTSLDTRLFDETLEHSINPTLGIFEILKKYAGEFPNYDNDDILDILYLDILDNFEETGSYVAGFFDPVDLSDLEFSNKRDLIYLDVYPTLFFEGQEHPDRSLSTLAHELQHLIHANYEGTDIEYIFANEGFSEVIEVLCGYPPRGAHAYRTHSNKSLLSWDVTFPFPDYSRASLWTLYLVEQFGAEILKHMIQNPKIGITGYESSIRAFGGKGFQDVFRTWGIANVVNNTQLSSTYGYAHSDIRGTLIDAVKSVDYFPDILSSSISQHSHIAIEIPFVEFLEWKASNSNLEITILPYYPKQAYTDVISENINTGTQEHKGDFGSITALISNSTSSVAGYSTLNMKFTGRKNAFQTTLGFGDGKNDLFYRNASYLSLNNSDQQIALILPKQAQNYWLQSFSISTVYNSELVGKEYEGEERDFLVSIHLIEQGKIGKQLIEPTLMVTNREKGKLVIEQFSLEPFYSVLHSISDTVAIIIKNDTDDSNYMAVGMDKAELTSSLLFYQGEWKNMADVHIGSFSLLGFNPNIRAHIALRNPKVTQLTFITDISYDFDGLQVTIEPPLAYDSTTVSLIAKLPDGSFIKELPFSKLGNKHLFNIPLQVHDSYELTASFRSVDGTNTYLDQQTWQIDTPDGFILSNNYPNPFNPSTNIPFTLLEEAEIAWEVYDILGRKVRNMLPRNFQSGIHIKTLDMEGMASGMYLVRAILTRKRISKPIIKTQKVMLIR
jgi:hypothetical protein